MSITRNLTIKQKLTLIIMLTSVTALAMACVGFITNDLLSIRNGMVRDLSRLAEIIGAGSARGLADEDPETAGESLSNIPSSRQIVSVCLYARSGKLVSGYVRAAAGAQTCPPVRRELGHRFEDGLLLVSQRIFLDGAPVGSVFLRADTSELKTALQHYAAIVGLVLLAALLAAFLLSARLQKVISQPILHLAAATRSISVGKDYSIRVEKWGNDELGQLTDGFNEMLAQIQLRDDALRKAREDLERRVEERTRQLLQETNSRQEVEKALGESEEQLRQSQKMDAIGRLAGGIAHDFNNLLTGILGYSSIVLRNLEPSDPLEKQVREIQKAGKRAASLTRQLLAFSRKQVLEPRVLDLNEMIASLEKMLRRLIGEDIELVTAPSDALGSVKADPGQIEQVILNLVVNARDAMLKGGQIVIETTNVDEQEPTTWHPEWVPVGPHVLLAVSDTGCGMSDETRGRIFEPFFTTKELGKGTGLGLSTVYGIVKQSGGHINVYSEEGVGTTFKIYLPRVEEAAETVARGETLPALRGGAETILVVEDDETVRTLALSILRMNGYAVLEAPHGGEALLLCETFKSDIHLMLTDVVMPHLNGRDLYDRVLPLRPEMKVLFMSGYTDASVVYQGGLHTGAPFIQKPFTPESLSRKIRQVLDEGQRPAPPGRFNAVNG
ncbi:MAG: ATP-binding protein [Acidobacteriota bacterium]